MGKGVMKRTHFQVILRESREDASGNLRRSARGSVNVVIGEKYGEASLVVGNLRYLGTTPNGWPYYYAGWLILTNGQKISMGPVSTDAKGSGKGYWRFTTATAGNPGIAVSEIAGFAVTVEAMDGNPYPTALVVLAGTMAKEKAIPGPDYASRPIPWAQRPGQHVGTAKKGADNPAYLPYSWWPVWAPGAGKKEAPLLFGHRMCDSGVERVAFGFPGLADQPALTGEEGEWRPTGMDNPCGYWIYQRELNRGRGLGARA